jgi:acyl-CoA reductase-like NAD-dependent aldehyde dehydrogenase
MEDILTTTLRESATENTESLIDGKNLIGGRWVSGSSGQTFDSLNPANTDDVVGRFPRSTSEDVIAAVDAAQAAFPAWSRTPVPLRADVLLRVAEIMTDRKEELARLMTREMGKVLEEARGDVQEGIDMAKYIAGEGRRFFGETVPSELRDKFAAVIRQPLGVVGLITPWNFPIAIPTWKTFPAILAGNTVVLKPAEDTPACAAALYGILSEAGLPDGIVNLVHGFGEEAGQPLIEDERVKMISFTGSGPVGREVASRAARHLKKVSLELGGKNPIIVMGDADLELALEGALWGAFGTSGQRCTAASRLIVERSVVDEFTSRLTERAAKLKVGNGLEPDVQMGPVINESQLNTIHSYTEVGKAEGARLLLGGAVLTEEPYTNGFFYSPTIFTDVNYRMRIAQEEIFGPTTVIMPVQDYDEAVAVANSVEYGLSSSIYTRDVNRAFHAIHDLQSGIVYVNAPTIGAEIQLPFGGTKATGNGHREAGTSAIREFTELKSVYVDYSGRLQRAQIDTE